MTGDQEDAIGFVSPTAVSGSSDLNKVDIYYNNTKYCQVLHCNLLVFLVLLSSRQSHRRSARCDWFRIVSTTTNVSGSSPDRWIASHIVRKNELCKNFFAWNYQNFYQIDQKYLVVNTIFSAHLYICRIYRGQIFHWSSQTCSRVSQLFGCDHAQKPYIQAYALWIIRNPIKQTPWSHGIPSMHLLTPQTPWRPPSTPLGPLNSKHAL